MACPTCGSNQWWMDRSPTSSGYNWHQYPRDGASFICPDPWHTRPTQETDPRPDPLPYGHNPFMTARDEANEPDYLNRPTQETDPG